MRILVVEDEQTLASVMQKRFTQEGYGVDVVHDGDEAMLFINMGEYDCILLDIMLPKRNGISVLKELRSRGNATPVMLVTARDSIEDRVTGLDAGADDYLVKPFSQDELSARVRAMLRRYSGQKSTVLSFGDLVMDTTNRSVQRCGSKIELSAKEFSLLEYLMRNPNRILTRAQIIDHVWNYDFDSSSNVVDVYIRYLRNKIDDKFSNKLIQTIRGTGYALRNNDE